MSRTGKVHECNPRTVSLYGIETVQCGCGRYFEPHDFINCCSCGCNKPLIVGKSEDIEGKWYLNGHGGKDARRK